MTADQAPTYFISDLHLDASRHAVTEAFGHFLHNTAIDARAIYILGDFFDAWIGDDDNAPYILKIKALLASCVSRGVDIRFVHGNRDFLIGQRFARDTGVRLLDDSTLINLYGETTLIMHGDTLCTDDEAYQAFRKKVRDPNWQKRMLRYPLTLRRLIAAYMRRRSRKANSNKAESIMDVSPSTVEDAFTSHKVTKLIHGHTHRPFTHQLTVNNQACERIVLGDWESKGWYLKADNNGQALVSFPI